jgi:hypothetical protein
VENLDQLAARDSGRGGIGEVNGDVSFIHRSREPVASAEEEEVREWDESAPVWEDDPGEGPFIYEAKDLGDVVSSDDPDGDVVGDQRNSPHPQSLLSMTQAYPSGRRCQVLALIRTF